MPPRAAALPSVEAAPAAVAAAEPAASAPTVEPEVPSWKQVFTQPLAEQTIVAAAEAPPTEVPVAKAVADPLPAVAAAKPAPGVPEKTPAPTVMPAMQPVGPKTPWLDYIGAFAMAIVVGGTIFFFTRDRKRIA